jgi:hypothetical protein
MVSWEACYQEKQLRIDASVHLLHIIDSFYIDPLTLITPSLQMDPSFQVDI